MRFPFIFILTLCNYVSQAQVSRMDGKVEDAKTHDVLAGATIMLFRTAGILGGVSNQEGNFSIHNSGSLDSVEFSMIGYKKKVYAGSAIKPGSLLRVRLEEEPAGLKEVIIHPQSALDIVRKATLQIPFFTPSKDFGSKAFYREIIGDSQRYYSVAEAIFNIQFDIKKKSYKLQLDKGRSKEDVAYTRLFEDFHPGGGPEDAVAQSLLIRQPDFLTSGSLKNYDYKKDSLISRDGRMIYIIDFDQKPALASALEKGKLYIDADDYSIVRYEAWNSPLGTPYIKSLKGSDKVFAEILHIDLSVKGWQRMASFTKIAGKLFLNNATMTYLIDYKQPKKSLDMHLTIHTEWMVTDFEMPIVQEIPKGEEWKRKDLVANLPTDFDSTFWGSKNILNPTTEIRAIIDSLSKKNGDLEDIFALDGWQYLNKGFFNVLKVQDTITLVPLVKCSWEDDQTGGMIFKTLQGDFNIETRLKISKRSNPRQEPDNGFQQSGIIVRCNSGIQENHLIFSLGTGGNDRPKYFLKRTTDGKTKGLVERIDHLSEWVRFEKRGKIISAYSRPDEGSSWTKIDDYESDWLSGTLQVGFSIMARFSGDGPKQHPDMMAIFSNSKIENL
jgi:hypothetical protein